MFTRNYPDGLLIRPPRPEDGPKIFEYFTHPNVARTIRSHPATEYSLTESWLERQNEQQHRFLAILADRPVGSVGLHISTNPREPRQGHLGIMVHQDYWGRGIGRRLLSHVLDLADYWLNLDRVELEVFAVNERAHKLYESLGFVVEGRRRQTSVVAGQKVDSIMMARLRPPPGETWSGPFPTLEALPTRPLDEAVTIRPVAAGDLDSLYELWLHPDVWGPTTHLPSLEYPAARNRLADEANTTHRLVAAAGKQILGLATLWHRSQNPRRGHSADAEIVVHPGWRRQGIGTQLGEALLDLADNWLNLTRVTTRMPAEHGAASALAHKLGFGLNAVSRRALFGYGHYLDMALMSRLNGVEAPPSYPATANVEPPQRQPLPGPIQVRAFHYDDIPALYRLFSHPLIANTTAQLPSLELKALEARLRPTTPRRYRLVATAGAKVIGMISIDKWDMGRQAHGAGLGMMVDPVYWGYGVGSQLMMAITDLADNWLGLRRIDLEVTTDNPAGIALYKKFGFQHEGTIPYYLFGGGRWAHVHVMSRWH